MNDGTTAYSWDRANRLLSAGGVSYAYNGLGQRVSQAVGGTTTAYLLDVQPELAKVLSETTSGSVTRYVHGPRGLLVQEDAAGNWEWPVQDGLGSVRGMAADDLSVLESRVYAPYGEPFGTTGTQQTPFGFTGEQTDTNELVYLRARYHNPAIGAFLSLDPVEGDLQRIMSLNRYGYVQANPTNRVDPSGRVYETISRWDTCNKSAQSDCQEFWGQNPHAYVNCLEEIGLDPCPPGWERAGEFCHSAEFYPGSNVFSSVAYPIDLWGDLWRCEGNFIADYSQIRAEGLRSIAQEAGIDPVLLGAIVQNEYSVSHFERSISLGLAGIFGIESFGIAQIQTRTAERVLENYPNVFEDFTDGEEIKSVLHEDPVFSLRVAAFYIADLRQKILHDLMHEEKGDQAVRIALGSGDCLSEETCTISEQQLEELIILAYNQGWEATSKRGVLDLLRTNRSGTMDWYRGILNTIEANPQLERVWRLRHKIETCLNILE